jgi:prohibitin 1
MRRSAKCTCANAADCAPGKGLAAARWPAHLDKSSPDEIRSGAFACHFAAPASRHTIAWEGMFMTTFNNERVRITDVGPGPVLRLVSLGVVGLILIILLFASVARVESGHVGVLTLFGRVTGEILPEGIHLVNPFKANHQMSIRTQEIKESASVPSSEGLVMNLDTSLIYHVNPEKAAEVYQKIGPNYVDVLVEPNLRAAIRESTASHTANALYTGEREMVAKQIYEQLIARLSGRGFTVESILLRDIQLPATLKASIEAKQQAEQEALAMSFRLQKETQEAQRKRIEAQGIRDFQQIVAQGISPQLLEWKGIEATENLSKSSNTKVVVIGNSKNGLPLILGQ